MFSLSFVSRKFLISLLISSVTYPACIDARLLACGGSAPVRVEREGGASAWLAGTLATPSVQGHRLPPPQELWPCQSRLSSLLWLAIRRPLWPVFLRNSAHSGT